MKNNWIKLVDRYPPKDVYVLIALYDSRPKVQMYFIQIAKRFDDDWYDDSQGDRIESKGQYITHWMPLPDEPSKLQIQ